MPAGRKGVADATGLRLIALAAALGASGFAAAQDDEAPDLDFLEYLGSWQDGDDEWVVVAGVEEGFVGTPAVGDPALDEEIRRQARREPDDDEPALAAEEADETDGNDETDEADETDED